MLSTRTEKGVESASIFKIILVIVLVIAAVVAFGAVLLDWDVAGFFQGFTGSGGGTVGVTAQPASSGGGVGTLGWVVVLAILAMLFFGGRGLWKRHVEKDKTLEKQIEDAKERAKKKGESAKLMKATAKPDGTIGVGPAKPGDILAQPVRNITPGLPGVEDTDIIFEEVDDDGESATALPLSSFPWDEELEFAVPREPVEVTIPPDQIIPAIPAKDIAGMKKDEDVIKKLRPLMRVKKRPAITPVSDEDGDGKIDTVGEQIPVPGTVIVEPLRVRTLREVMEELEKRGKKKPRRYKQKKGQFVPATYKEAGDYLEKVRKNLEQVKDQTTKENIKERLDEIDEIIEARQKAAKGKAITFEKEVAKIRKIRNIIRKKRKIVGPYRQDRGEFFAEQSGYKLTAEAKDEIVKVLENVPEDQAEEAKDEILGRLVLIGKTRAPTKKDVERIVKATRISQAKAGVAGFEGKTFDLIETRGVEAKKKVRKRIITRMRGTGKIEQSINLLNFKRYQEILGKIEKVKKGDNKTLKKHVDAVMRDMGKGKELVACLITLRKIKRKSTGPLLKRVTGTITGLETTLKELVEKPNKKYRLSDDQTIPVERKRYKPTKSEEGSWTGPDSDVFTVGAGTTGKVRRIRTASTKIPKKEAKEITASIIQKVRTAKKNRKSIAAMGTPSLSPILMQIEEVQDILDESVEETEKKAQDVVESGKDRPTLKPEEAEKIEEKIIEAVEDTISMDDLLKETLAFSKEEPTAEEKKDLERIEKEKHERKMLEELKKEALAEPEEELKILEPVEEESYVNESLKEVERELMQEVVAFSRIVSMKEKTGIISKEEKRTMKQKINNRMESIGDSKTAEKVREIGEEAIRLGEEMPESAYGNDPEDIEKNKRECKLLGSKIEKIEKKLNK